MKPLKDMVRFIRHARIDTKSSMDMQVQRKMRDAYDDSAPGHVTGYAGGRIARLAVAAVVLVGAGVLIDRLAGPFNGSVAWAQVAQRFQSVSFAYASIYVRNYALAEPRQYELWMGKGGYARMRVGSQVIFGRDGQVSRAFDIWQRRAVKADPAAADILRMLQTPDEVSLETVIRCLSGGKLVDITPAVNTEAAIGEDLAIFDAQSAVSPGWVRIYALRESKLPVGLRIWDPVEGFSVDALITYAKDQPAIFFDPNAFEARLTEPGYSNIALAYLFLKDPGGQDVTPGDLDR
ncbi:MAG TPA: hypothetical protein PKH24_05820 [Sedimentisphaerales bacterium]|jgi:hypothetical protein|nr:hypothetical protein [Sedimentisphaerales bacterium]HNU29102.1 hypothetical protein [Sedimentisphaerales bacterium]